MGAMNEDRFVPSDATLVKTVEHTLAVTLSRLEPLELRGDGID